MRRSVLFNIYNIQYNVLFSFGDVVPPHSLCKSIKIFDFFVSINVKILTMMLRRQDFDVNGQPVYLTCFFIIKPGIQLKNLPQTLRYWYLVVFD